MKRCLVTSCVTGFACEHSLGRQGLLFLSCLPGIYSASVCHHHPQNLLSFSFFRLWVSGFPPCTSLLSLLPVSLCGDPSEHIMLSLGLPVPWISQPYLAVQTETGDCQNYSQCLPCLFSVATLVCPLSPAWRLVPSLQPPSPIHRLLLSPGTFLAASVAQIQMAWIPCSPVLPACRCEAAEARSQKAAFARVAGAATAPKPSPAARLLPKSTDLSFLSWCWLRKKEHGRYWSEGLAAPKERLCLLGGWHPCFAYWEGLLPAAMEVLPSRGDGNTKNKTCLPLHYHTFCSAQNWYRLLNPCQTFEATSLLHLLTYHGFGSLFSLLLWVGLVQWQCEGEVRPNISLSKDEAKR